MAEKFKKRQCLNVFICMSLKIAQYDITMDFDQLKCLIL